MTAERDITFRLRVRDESGEGFAALKSKAEATGPAMEGVVSKDLGNRLTHFNATGQKAAMILGQVGGSAGEAAGQVTRFGGVISSLVGRTSLLEAGLLAAGVAIVALGSKLYEIATGPVNAAVDALALAVEQSKKFREEIDAAMLAETQAILGLTENEKRYQRALEDRKRLMREILDLQIAQIESPLTKDAVLLDFLNQKWGTSFGLQKDSYDVAVSRLAVSESTVGMLGKEVDEERKLAALKEEQGDLVGVRAGRAPSAKKPETGHVLTEDYGPSREEEEAYEKSFGEDQDRVDAAIERERLKYEVILYAEKRYYEESDKLAEDNFELKKNYSDAQLEHEKDIARERQKVEEESYEATNNTIGIVGKMGANLVDVYEKIAVATAKSEKEAAKHRAIAAAMLAALKIGEEIAYAASDFAAEKYWSGALHVVAAAMWAAQAATANMQGGGGGGSASVAPSPGPTDRQYWQERKDAGQNAGLNIYISDTVIAGADADEAIFNMLKRYERRRNPGAARNEIEV